MQNHRTNDHATATSLAVLALMNALVGCNASTNSEDTSMSPVDVGTGGFTNSVSLAQATSTGGTVSVPNTSSVTATGGTEATGGQASTGGTQATGGASSGTGTSSTSSGTEFAPYFYTWGWGNTAYPFTSLVDLKNQTGLMSVTLAFVLSDGTCAATTDIEAHLTDVKAFVAAGGHVKASFGGANGTYLENACSNAQSLATAIEDFVTMTGITDLDFDVEQAGAMDAATNLRRAQALKTVQASKQVRVSYTLAATPRDKWNTPGGLSTSSLAVVKATIDAGVKLSHVNLMTMDYGGYYSDGQAMGALAISALTETKSQLLNTIPGLDEASAWRMLGATPMIGQNDVSTEVFTLDDAKTLVAFVKTHQVGLVSFWAINRDQPCPYKDLGVCSEVNLTTYAFTKVFQGV